VISDALLGAFVGAVATLGTQGLASAVGWRRTRDLDRRQLDATALVNQDDFEHFQAMLLRALDRERWWYSWEQSDPQATIDDRKNLWAALPEERAECVANAQGWVDYLKGQRLAVCADGSSPAGAALAEHPPPLTTEQTTLIRDTFERLEEARYAISLLTKRSFAPFEGLRVTTTLEHHDRLADLGLGDIDYAHMSEKLAARAKVLHTSGPTG
jgi:hypothetical protein